MLPKGILSTDNVSVGEAVSSKKRVLEQAARLLSAGHDTPTTEQVFEHLLERERLGSTGLAGGVGLPHARMAEVEATRGAFLRLAKAVEFDALDGEPVDLVFALLVPEDATEQHLQLLADLAKMFNDEDLRNHLRQADPEQAIAILTGKSPTHAT